jgi:hypothetical protein
LGLLGRRFALNTVTLCFIERCAQTSNIMPWLVVHAAKYQSVVPVFTAMSSFSATLSSATRVVILMTVGLVAVAAWIADVSFEDGNKYAFVPVEVSRVDFLLSFRASLGASVRFIRV